MYIKWARLYIFYNKVPWELGYPYLEEIDALMPMIYKTVKKRQEIDSNPQAQADWNSIKSSKST